MKNQDTDNFDVICAVDEEISYQLLQNNKDVKHGTYMPAQTKKIKKSALLIYNFHN